MSDECRFELKDLRCAECHKPTGNQGTCDDVDFCPKCRAECDELNRPGTSAQLVIQLIEGHKWHAPRRKMHAAKEGQPLCGAKGDTTLTADLEEMTCGRCLRMF